MLGGLITIAGGLIASSGFIVKRKPNAQELLDKLTPYQGWIGVVMFGWGIREIFSLLTHMSLLAARPILFALWAAVGVADLLVGFLLGFGLITKYALGKNEEALRRGQQIRGKLVGAQSTLGLLAIFTGVAYLVWMFV